MAQPLYGRLAAVPSTPKKRDTTVEDKVEWLNRKYGLEIEVPKPNLTPSKRKELRSGDNEFARWDTICTLIRFLFYQGMLEKSLNDFQDRAQRASQNWVPKPKADPSTLPNRSGEIPKATTPHHRVELEQLLLEVLAEYKERAIKEKPGAKPTTAPSAFTRSRSDVTPLSVIAESAGSAKRPSDDEESDHSAKRRRPQQPITGSKQPPSLSRASSSPTPRAPGLPLSILLGSVPTRQRPGPDRSRREAFPEQRNGLNGEDGFNPTQPTPQSASKNSSLSTHKSPIFSQFTERYSSNNYPTQVESSEDDKSPTSHVVQETARMSLSSHSSRAHQPSQFASRTETQISDSPVPFSPRNVSRVLFPPKGSDTNKPRQLSRPSSIDSFKSDSSDLGGAEIIGPDDPPAARPPALTPLQERLQNIWPKLPSWLQRAPLAVAWEITRICLHCKVGLDDATSRNIQYNPAWATMTISDLWRSLAKLPAFQGRDFPERPSPEAYTAATTKNFEANGNVVVMSASLEFNPDDKHGPLFLVDMKPLRFDQGCRLTRKFGPDRFFEVLLPSPTAMSAPPMVKAEGGAEAIVKWVTSTPHELVGRRWRAFYAKDAGYRKPARDFRLGPDIKPTFKERIHFFAEAGQGLRRATDSKLNQSSQFTSSNYYSMTVGPAKHTEMQVSQMLDWLLELHRPKNQQQPVLKLFSRIQLGLSKTTPTVVFEPHQIRQHREDILSPIGKVMNDGIGLMSRSVARRIRDILGLSDIPSAVQARLGPAKGMWLVDVKDMGQEDWIETYPSQRKWECDWEQADAHQRTLEVRNTAVELKSAGLNLQFLPVLEDRAKDKALMRQAIGQRLKHDLEKEFETQKMALKSPPLLRQWVNEHWSGRAERVRNGAVSFLGGLPEKKEEILNLLLASGFDPMKQKYLQEQAWDLQKQKCDLLKTKMNIKVARSAYIYMVVDFWGVLEENEVHVGFSSKFRDESDDTSYTLLADCDVLVARSPAHFVSDVQRVKAVFKSELHALKDVVVFPRKGNVALADKLSGGDYDGDMAWVCWDPDIVGNFVNADVPKEPDLSAYLGKDKTTFQQLARSTQNQDRAVSDMISRSFQFAMQPNYLGICTNYKERLCYHNNSVSNDAAVTLSTLVGKLVDQSKQGIIFNNERWKRLCKDLFGTDPQLDDPAYHGNVWKVKELEPQHIIDYLKFWVANPAINRELDSFHQMMQGSRTKGNNNDPDVAYHYDQDLVTIHNTFKEAAAGSRTFTAIYENLRNSIDSLNEEWKREMIRKGSSALNYQEKVRKIYAKWCEIPIRSSSSSSQKLDSKTAMLLEMPRIGGSTDAGAPSSPGCYSFWELLKASMAFKLCYERSPKFMWQMAGSQLAYIKAVTVSRGQAPIVLTPLMYAGLSVDGKFTKQYLARTAMDVGSEYFADEDGEGAVDDDE